MSTIRTIAMAALICVSTTSTFAASNLLVNGDFEDGIAVDLGKSYYGPRMTYPVGWIDLANGAYRYP